MQDQHRRFRSIAIPLLASTTLALGLLGCSFSASTGGSVKAGGDGSASGSSSSSSKSSGSTKISSKSSSSISGSSSTSGKASASASVKGGTKGSSSLVFQTKPRTSGVVSVKTERAFSSLDLLVKIRAKGSASVKGSGSVKGSASGSTKGSGSGSGTTKPTTPKTPDPKPTTPKTPDPKPTTPTTPKTPDPKPTTPTTPPTTKDPEPKPPTTKDPEPTEPPVITPIDPPEEPPDNVFGYEDPVRGCFEGIVYPLSVDAQRLPTNYPQLEPISVVYACEWDIPKRDWSAGFPSVEDHFEWFAIRYSGAFEVEQEGTWNFRLSSDDGSKLYIDGKLVIDNDGQHEAQSRWGSVQLSKGEHEMVLEYFQGPRYHINLQLYATPPGGQEGIFSVR